MKLAITLEAEGRAPISAVLLLDPESLDGRFALAFAEGLVRAEKQYAETHRREAADHVD